MTCPKKIRPFPNTVELLCELTDGHEERHTSVLRNYAYPGSETRITWADTDRRTFSGTWTPCDESSCPLPAGHRGNHAR